MENKSILGPFQLITLALSVYVLGAIAAATFFRLDRDTERLLDLIDLLICIVFFSEFLVNLYRADNKLKFMKWGWIDLVSSIPAYDVLRAGRILRIIRILRLFRAFRSMRAALSHVFINRVKSAFATATLLAISTLIFASIAILQVETAPESNIKTAEDSLWWAFTTITTVGYGDRYPVTTEGRIIAAGLMVVGVGLFGVFAGFVASWLMGEDWEKEIKT